MAYVIEQSKCSACHRCRVYCPVQAITWKNAKYWIDPDKCVSCGKCFSVCHNECITPDKPQPAPEAHAPIALDCDLCVVGGGAAGTAAAARAAANGKKVILLEKGKEVGGSAYYAHMFAVHYSKMHAEAGMPDKREAKYEEFMKKTGGQINGQLVKNAFWANTHMIDWLIDDYDLKKDFHLGQFGPAGIGLVCDYEEEYNTRRIDTTIGPCGNGWYFCNKFLSILLEKGGQVFYHTVANQLLTDETGAITGVLASDPGGEYRISCKAVVLAAGAFTHNHAIMDKMQPLFYGQQPDKNGYTEPVHVFTCAHCTGDGIAMGEAIGADVDYEHRRVNLFGPRRHPYPCVTLACGESMSAVKITSDGRPFNAMGMTEVSPLTFEPGRYCWNIEDAPMVESALKQAMHPVTKDVVGIDLDKFYEQWEDVLIEEEKGGAIVKADTLEELGEKLGLDGAAFAKMVAEENEKPMQMMMPPMGGDDEGPGGPGGPGGEGPGGPEGGAPGGMPGMPPMVKQKVQTAPFYAFKLKLFHENAVGGLAINENMQVLKNGAPIPGLYAAGDNCNGIMLPGEIGVRYIEGVFSALTWSMNSGYLAGAKASEFLA